MWLQVRCEIDLEFDADVPMILMLRPRSGGQQWVARDTYQLDPVVPVEEFTDMSGNLCQRLVAKAGLFRIHTEQDVQVCAVIDQAPGAPFTEIPALPGGVLIYLAPSRYCESDSLWDAAMEITNGYAPGYDQVAAITRWVRHAIRYAPDADPRPVSATTVYQSRVGVCRDFAHLAISLCRSLSIPARFVVGYLQNLEPMDMHAWFEAFVGGRWYTFDAMDLTLKGGRVTVAYGRDAADTVMFTQFGPPVAPCHMLVSVKELAS